MAELKLNWGFLGYGQVAGERMAPAVIKNHRSELYAVATMSHSGTDIPAKKLYSSYDRLIEDDAVDIVYIALPNTMHEEWTIKALNRGKHVLCEKPVAMSVADLDRIAEVSQATGYKVMEGFMYRYSDRMKEVQKVFDSGRLGDLRYIQSNFFSLQSRFAGIRSNRKLGGGCLWDLGCYPVSFITALFGGSSAADLKPHVHTLGHGEKGLDVYLAGNIGFDNGCLGSFACGWISEVRDITTMVIGTKGILEVQRLFNWDEGKLRVTLAGGTDEKVLPAEDPFEKEIEAFLRYIVEDQPLVMPLWESRRNIECMELISSGMILS